MSETKTLSPLDILDTLDRNPHGLGARTIVKRTLNTDNAPDPLVDATKDTLDQLHEGDYIKGGNGQHFLNERGVLVLEGEEEIDIDGDQQPDDQDSSDDSTDDDSTTDEDSSGDDLSLEDLASEVPDHLDAEEIVNYTSGRTGKTYKYKPGERRVEKDRADEEMEVNYYFPARPGEERTLKRFLTDGEACPLKRRIISEDAIADGFAEDESEFKKRAIRLVCPHCGRATGADINNEGDVRIATHVLPDGDTSPPTVEHFVFEGDDDSDVGEDWTLVDPSNS